MDFETLKATLTETLQADWMLFFTFLLACGAAATTGAVFKPGAWYASLAKPWWTPPNWLFPLAWFTLYILMSFAAMRVAPLEGSAQAMALWSVQIAFNTLWTPIFFGLKRMFGGLIVIVFLWSSVAATAWTFWQLDPIAGGLMAPYVLWATIAALLNLSVWMMNLTGPRGEKVAMKRAAKARAAEEKAIKVAERARAEEEKVLARRKAALEAAEAQKAVAAKAAADKAEADRAEAVKTVAAVTDKPQGAPAE